MLCLARQLPFLLQRVELLPLPLLVQLLLHLRRLIVEDNEVPSANVEARKVVNGVLRVVDILVDDKGRAFCIVHVAPVQRAERAVGEGKRVWEGGEDW